MKNISKHQKLSLKMTEEAREIVKILDIHGAWRSIGAEVNQVGSLRMGLLCKHRDIDFHVYTDKLDIHEGFNVIGIIASNPSVESVQYGNLADTDEKCLEWHLWYRYNGSLWQIDIIQILRGSTYDGYFEKVADTIVESSSDEQKDIIIRLKYETPETIKIPGIEYYIAVIKYGVREYGEFIEWRKSHPFTGIVEW